MSPFRRIEHLRYRRFLDASADGELIGERARRVRAHLSACPRCARDEDLTVMIKHRLWVLRVWQPPVLRRRSDEP